MVDKGVISPVFLYRSERPEINSNFSHIFDRSQKKNGYQYWLVNIPMHGFIEKSLCWTPTDGHVYCAVDPRWEKIVYSSMTVIQNIMLFEAFSR